MPPLPKYLKKNADELRKIRRNQPVVSYEEALRQVERVARREGVGSSLPPSPVGHKGTAK